jgi:nitronate monooxygenase
MSAYGELLNTLLEAERAGARLLAAWMDELPPQTPAWQKLRAVQRDEARNCSVLIHLLLEAGVTPSGATGEFYRKGLSLRDWRERVDFLNRGQAWVARRIAAALPAVPAPDRRFLLEEMYQSHVDNVVDADAIAGTPQRLASSNAA